MRQGSIKDLSTLPVGRLGIMPLESCTALGEKVNSWIVQWRKERNMSQELGFGFEDYERDSFIIHSQVPRFGSGEAKGMLDESVRGDDIYILVDVCNYSLTYTIGGYTNRMSPDDHFQDLKRVIAAVGGKARRINVIMPYLYESRQHKRTDRESLDCAMALQELTKMGVENILTFDAHDDRIQNATPLHGLETIRPAYQFIKGLLNHEKDLDIDNEHLMVISPDENGMSRAIYLANVLGVDMGMFYKRRDYSRIIDGRNPIVAHEFLGSSVEGKTVLIIDDMIASGESMLDTARALKERKAKKVIICCTFGLFTGGLEKFDDFYEKGYIDYVITTNLNYRPLALFDREWYLEADMGRYLAAIINSFNHDVSIEAALSSTEKIQKLVRQYQAQKKTGE